MPTSTVPPHRILVLPWLKRIGQRYVLPNWLAITIRSWIFAWRPLDEAELAHELAHVRQWREHGFVGYIRNYMAESARAKREGKDRYRDNRFEVEARAAEDEARAKQRD